MEVRKNMVRGKSPISFSCFEVGWFCLMEFELSQDCEIL